MASQPSNPTQILRTLLTSTSHPPTIHALVSPTATYTSLNTSNATLSAILPYAGIHRSVGPQAIIDTFATVGTIWEKEASEFEALFGEDDHVATKEVEAAVGRGIVGVGDGDGADVSTLANVAAFGTFTYRARTTGKRITSPFSVWAVVDRRVGQVVRMQFMEDTLGSTDSFLVGEGQTKRYRVFEGEDEVVV